MINRENIKKTFREVLTDDKRRIRFQYLATFVILGTVSLVMSIINLFTKMYLLFSSTLIFCVLSYLNVGIALKGEKGMKIATSLFPFEFISLLTFFIVSGTPEGFSAIWAALLPTCGILLYQARNGTLLSFLMFVIIAFFFWTPLGRSLLRYDYTESFMLRFPVLYLAFYTVSLFLEYVRSLTFDNFHYLSYHDQLTGAYNRRGFTDIVNEHLETTTTDTGFMICDLDHFKNVNDTYGHFTGDAVLAETARRLIDLTGMPVCRWGGEEFAIIDKEGVLSQELMDKYVRDFSRDLFVANGNTIHMTISIGGILMKDSEELTADILGKAADDCLYQAKESGRNKAIFKDYTK